MTYPKDFTKEELSCKCGCRLEVKEKLVWKLQASRTIACIPFIVSSGARCEKHNRNEGGSPTSSHLKGLAVDISYVTSGECFLILFALISAGFNRIGIGKDFIHADIDESKPGDVLWTYYK